MRLNIVKSKNATSYYVQKTVYKDGRQTSVIVEKLGTYAAIKERLNGADPLTWAKQRVEELSKKEQEEKAIDLHLVLSSGKIIDKNEQRLFNGGYLFLKQIYKRLELTKLCKHIAKKYKFKYDLDSILSRLLYSRIIYPDSKLATFELSKQFIEKPNFDLHHIYRALDVLETESDLIQATVYENSLKIVKRKTGVLYYDLTNYFFELEQASGYKQYGYSKEHRPNPIVQMGLFMDGSGIPLAFNINPGNTSEQTTMKPLEQKILKDFNLSKFIVCTDAGLASEENRKFNSCADRAFITIQSIKKLKGYLRKWCLEPNNWRLSGSTHDFDLTKIDEEEHKNSIFFKERWIKENGFEQRLIVTFSLKYRNYLQTLRSQQIDRASNLIKKGATKLKKNGANDCKRFIKRTDCTANGEIAETTVYTIDKSIIENEQAYDGFYAVCTNIEDQVAEIIAINKKRWEIEECFRIMKSEFKARPVYLSKDNRIKAHFLTCFLALLVYRLLEAKLNNNFTCGEIVQGLKDMNFTEIKRKGYIPSYERTKLTDAFHEEFGFRTDYDILTYDQINKIIKMTNK
ncbi:MAG: IS1634 family transposase [Candidatus Riflebacteria bacterium]|nr:IS1634 family transposase [Candidatus Riflebacteria bacterium]